jgi:hypothetical protein
MRTVSPGPARGRDGTHYRHPEHTPVPLRLGNQTGTTWGRRWMGREKNTQPTLQPAPDMALPRPGDPGRGSERDQ